MHLERSISKRKKPGMECRFPLGGPIHPNNNMGFMHQLGMGMCIWLHKETVIIDRMQQISLNQMEGKTAPIHRKGKVSVEQEWTPYIMTCNNLPWLPIQDLEIRKAFHNKCFFFMT